MVPTSPQEVEIEWVRSSVIRGLSLLEASTLALHAIRENIKIA
jgi:hypothetical protein